MSQPLCEPSPQFLRLDVSTPEMVRQHLLHLQSMARRPFGILGYTGELIAVPVDRPDRYELVDGLRAEGRSLRLGEESAEGGIVRSREEGDGGQKAEGWGNEHDGSEAGCIG